MKVAIYPGSFNPWHEGHSDILKKALKVFDRVIIAVGKNRDKSESSTAVYETLMGEFESDRRVGVTRFDGLLVDLVKEVGASAVVRGLRNGVDLQFESTQQYWNEDLGISVPTVYFVCDRKLVHISSSAIRMVAAIKKGE